MGQYMEEADEDPPIEADLPAEEDPLEAEDDPAAVDGADNLPVADDEELNPMDLLQLYMHG